MKLRVCERTHTPFTRVLEKWVSETHTYENIRYGGGTREQWRHYNIDVGTPTRCDAHVRAVTTQ